MLRKAGISQLTARWRRWRGVLLGTAVGSLLAAGMALAYQEETHTAALWHHGMGIAAGNDAHPFLSSTDNAHRVASASHQWCYNSIHGPNSEYQSNHVHQDLYMDHEQVEAHLYSSQTALSHHVHHYC